MNMATKPQADKEGEQESIPPVYGLAAIWAEIDSVRYLSKPASAWQLVTEAFRTIFTLPLNSLLSLVSISAALFIFGLFLIFFQNAEELLTSSSSELAVSVYLNDQISNVQRDEIFDYLSELTFVKDVELWGKAKALEEFRKSFSEYNQIGEGLTDNNPLPASFEVKFKPDFDSEQYANLIEKLKSTQGVIHVGYAQEFFEQLRGLIYFFRNSGAFAVLIILLVTGFVIASTIRLALFYREDELSIMRLVGAETNAIRIPCLIEGLLYGLIGGVIGVAILYLFYNFMLASMSGIPMLLSLAKAVKFLTPVRILAVLSVGMVVGVMSSAIAVRRVVGE